MHLWPNGRWSMFMASLALLSEGPQPRPHQPGTPPPARLPSVQRLFLLGFLAVPAIALDAGQKPDHPTR